MTDTPKLSDTLVFFGVTGDLAYKQIFPALQSMIKHGNLDIPVIGVAGRPWSIDQLREHVHDSLEEHGGVDPTAFEKLCSMLQYVSGDYKNEATYTKLRKALGGAMRPLYYLAIPPSFFGPVVEGLGKSGCANGARVVIEKPFGRDLASAQSLNQILHSVFPESSIFRIDHYLGKEPVQIITASASVRSSRSHWVPGPRWQERPCMVRELSLSRFTSLLTRWHHMSASSRVL